jgi:hypothetical protein
MRNTDNIKIRFGFDVKADRFYCKGSQEDIDAIMRNSDAKNKKDLIIAIKGTEEIVSVPAKPLMSLIGKEIGSTSVWGSRINLVFNSTKALYAGCIVDIGLAWFEYKNSNKTTKDFNKFMGSISIMAMGIGTSFVLTSIGAPSIVAGLTVGIVGYMLSNSKAEDIGSVITELMEEQGDKYWQDKLNAMYLCDETDVTHPFGTAATMQKVDPIALDLNGDGITFGSATDGYAQFDMDKNGFKERAAWLNNADGFLARDINGNGLIDDGSELFGDQNNIKEWQNGNKWF